MNAKVVIYGLCLCLIMSGCSIKGNETVFSTSEPTTAATTTAVQTTESTTAKTLTGYIRLSDDLLCIDEVDYITLDDTDKIAEYGLNPTDDMPVGWCVRPLGKEPVSFKLTKETLFTFTDLELLFVEESDEDRKYSTKDVTEFIEHLSLYFSDSDISDGGIKYLFYINIADDNVVSVEEDFGSTI